MMKPGEVVEFYGTQGYYQSTQGDKALVLQPVLVPLKDVKRPKVKK